MRIVQKQGVTGVAKMRLPFSFRSRWTLLSAGLFIFVLFAAISVAEPGQRARAKQPRREPNRPNRGSLADRIGTARASIAAPRRWAGRTRAGALQTSLPATVQLIRDVKYGSGGGRDLHMNILRPKQPASTPMPVVVFVHGGGWRAGNYEIRQPLLTKLAEQGFFVASVEYRLSGEAPFPAQIEDCKCAVRYLRAHASKYSINPNAIGAWGTSAGGHLVALLGTAGDARDLEGSGGWDDQSSRVQAVVSSFGPTDLTLAVESADDSGLVALRRETSGPVTMLLGGPLAQKTDLARKASPVNYVSKDDPPFLMTHGEDDPVVPIQQSETLDAALKKVGVRTNLIRLPGGHGARTPESDREILDFFTRHLKTTQS